MLKAQPKVSQIPEELLVSKRDLFFSRGVFPGPHVSFLACTKIFVTVSHSWTKSEPG